MSVGSFRIKNSIVITGTATATENGELTVVSNKLQFHNGTISVPLITTTSTDTLTNKTISTGGTNIIGAVTIAGTTGSGNVVFSAAPTFSGATTFPGTTSIGSGGKVSVNTSTTAQMLNVGPNTGNNQIRISGGATSSGDGPALVLAPGGNENFYFGPDSVIRGNTNYADLSFANYSAAGRFVWNVGGAIPLILDNAGQLAIQTVGKGFSIKEGSNAKMGTSTLVAGSVVVSNTSVTASSRIFLMSNADGGVPGFVRVSTRTASTSFTITSSNVADTSTVAWMIVEPS